MKIDWIKCKDDNWCGLETVNLNHDHFNEMEGVYVIWFKGEAPNVVRVGQGDIRDRVSKHRENPEINAFSSEGKLLVTWAKLAPQYHDGVEAYLAEQLNPKVGERFPDVDPIEVNLPGK